MQKNLSSYQQQLNNQLKTLPRLLHHPVVMGQFSQLIVQLLLVRSQIFGTKCTRVFFLTIYIQIFELTLAITVSQNSSLKRGDFNSNFVTSRNRKYIEKHHQKFCQKSILVQFSRKILIPINCFTLSKGFFWSELSADSISIDYSNSLKSMQTCSNINNMNPVQLKNG